MTMTGQKRARAGGGWGSRYSSALLAFGAVGFAPGAARAATAPRVSIADVVVGERDGEASVVVSLSAPSASEVSVVYAGSGGTAVVSRGIPVAGMDAVVRPSTLTFAPGERTKTIPVEIIEDAVDEGLESFYVDLDSAVHATVATEYATVSIIDNDNDTSVGLPRLFARPVTVDEKVGRAYVPVLLGGPAGQASDRTVTVRYATADGTAIAGRDYRSIDNTLRFAPGETVKNVPIVITNDGLAEGAETLSLKLSAATNASIATRAATVRIGASDGRRAVRPRVSIADVVVGEGEGWTDVVVSLSAPSASVVSVEYAKSGGTALVGRGIPVAGQDAVVRATTLCCSKLTFAPGERTKTIRVEIIDDDVDEGLESFAVDLESSTHATIATDYATVSIIDNDNDTSVGLPRLFARPMTVDEKVGTAYVPVLLGGPAGQASDRTVTVRYATANGTAIAGRDYRATQSTLSFAPGETVKIVPIVINDDTVAEGAETLSLKLSAATNARIATPAATVRIGASDGRRVSRPRVSIADVVVGESVGWTDVVVSLSAPSASVVSVEYAGSNGTAVVSRGIPVAGQDAVVRATTLCCSKLTFAPGERTKTIRVEIIDDARDEGLESFAVDLDSSVHATIARSPATVRIRDND